MFFFITATSTCLYNAGQYFCIWIEQNDADAALLKPAHLFLNAILVSVCSHSMRQGTLAQGKDLFWPVFLSSKAGSSLNLPLKLLRTTLLPFMTTPCLLQILF